MPLRAENENPWTPAATTQKILAATPAHTHSSADAIYKEPMLWLIASIVLTHTLTIYANPRFVVEAAQRQEAPVIDADFTDWPGVLWLELAPKPAHQSPGYSPLRDDGNEELGIAGTAADLARIGDAHEAEAAVAEPEVELDHEDGEEQTLPSQQNLSKKERKAQKKLEKNNKNR